VQTVLVVSGNENASGNEAVKKMGMGTKADYGMG